MSQEGNFRSSDRRNKGVPPKLYGDWDFNTSSDQMSVSEGPGQPMTHPELPEKIGLKEEDDQSVNSAGSLPSVASFNRRRSRLDLETKLKQKKIEEERLLLEQQLALADLEDEEEEFMSIGTVPHILPAITAKEKVNNWVDQEGVEAKNGKSAPVSPSRHNLSSSGSSTEVRLTEDTLIKLGVAVATAIQNTNPQQQNTTEKFLARQSHSKELPTFSGKPEEWPTFYSSFQRTTEVCGYSKDENILRLRKCLKGEALKSVQCLLSSPNNMDKVIECLKLRFGDVTHIIDAMIRKAREVPLVKQDKLDSMIDFGEAVRNLTETMKALESEDHLRNPQLLKELMEKLPPSIRVECATGMEEKTLLSFSAWLEKRTRVLYQLCAPKIIEEKKKREQVLLTPDAEEDEDDEPPKKKEKKCTFCSTTGHRVAECKKFEKQSLMDRLKFVRTSKLCYGCLNFGHSTRDCKSKKSCGINGCKFNHHRLVHEEKKVENPKELAQVQNLNGEGKVFLNTPVLFQVLPVELKGPKGNVRVYALLDTGSSFTLLDEAVSKELGLHGTVSPLHFSTVTDSQQSTQSKQVKVEIVNTSTGKSFHIEDVRTYPNLSLGGGTLNDRVFTKWKHLRQIPIQPYLEARPKILIGLPHNFLMEPLKVVRGKNGPTAVETRLGWTLYGKISVPNETESVQPVHHIQHKLNKELHELVKRHFQLEELGTEKLKKLKSKSDKQAEASAQQTMKLDKSNSRYEIGLLWKSDNPQMPESRSQALRRLYSIEKKMDADVDFGIKYKVNMDHYLEKGYIRELKTGEISGKSQKTWYLPHFAVSKPHKPGKIRLVFDAAAISNGTSLNQELNTGPDILSPLPAVLSKFRQRSIAFTADIREMFHQVKMKSEDQHSQRLLWRGMDRNSLPREYCMAVMTFGATCSPYCAQLVKNTNAQRFQQQSPRAVEAILSRHYVDDYLDSTDTLEEAEVLVTEVSNIQKAGGFELCNWTSNSPDLMSLIPMELRAESQKDISAFKTTLWSERVLGLHWNPRRDCFFFTSDLKKIKQEILDGKKPTKREALSLVMSLFDPIGMVTHFTIKGKIILQKIWRGATDWDDEILDSVFENWTKWITDLRRITEMEVPRCYSPFYSKAMNIQIHTFCDASEEAYAAVCYLRIQHGSGVDISFAAAKARVTPLKSISIPRSELEAAVIGIRLENSVREWNELKPEKRTFWTDSSTVYHWVRMDGGNLKQFVAHRVGEIQEATEAEDWKWLPTHLNVADDATRLEAPVDFSKDSRWNKGPTFLKFPEEEWPQHFVPDVDIESLELKKGIIGNIKLIEPLIDISRFSNWLRIIRTTAYVIRCLNWKNKIKNAPHLTPEELEVAEQRWWKCSQANSFHLEIQLLEVGKELPKESKLKKLSPFLDENGILRMRSRVQEDFGTFENNPVILDSKESYTRLFIRFCHEKAGHRGMDQVCNNLKQRFCIPGLRAAVRKTSIECQSCKNKRSLPQPPQMAQLPSFRLQKFQRPFTFTGLDYFGPLEITIGRRREKRYGALFTCLVTRAVHVEMAGSLSSDSLIMALRRFIGRRGQPKEIHSDNGTNFVGGNRELKEALQSLHQEQITEELTNRGIKWYFIPPASPHMGGSWERMVRSVKTALYAVLKERAPREETLHTFLVEAENSVNQHPLTYVSSDTESEEVLTPNHFLLGSCTNTPSPGAFTDRDLILSNQWKFAQRLADHFWKRWLKEFLPTLTRRQKWHERSEPLKVGDIVLILDPDQPRNTWPRGIIVEVPESKDGQIRWAMVKTVTGTYKRPAVKLCRLDLGPRDPSQGNMSSDVESAFHSNGGECIDDNLLKKKEAKSPTAT